MSRKLDLDKLNGLIYGGLMCWGWYSIIGPENLILKVAAILWGLFLGLIIYIQFNPIENQEENEEGFKSLEEVELEIV